ncbi:MAG TPA: putative glycoside hydrolase, partial [candidate division Zixibacteria bacterium]|nr:putative glycoside hydrolase [candidate division Zixibacteria bacterium]
MLKKLNPGSGRLKDLQFWVRDLQNQGIYVIARQVVFNQPYMASKNPGWRIHGRWGGYYPEKWLDPSLPTVQEYNLSILREVAEMGFDEVQFDYIRFPAANHKNYDYAFDETRFTPADVIVDFLAKAKSVASDYGMAIGADVFGVIVWGDVDWRIVGQDPARIAKIVDAIYPMTYPSHFGNGFNGHAQTHNAPYGIVYDSIKRFVEVSGGNAEIRTWVQGFPLKVRNFGSWFMDEQVQATYDAGANDFVIWSPGNRYTYSWPSFKLEPKEANPVTTSATEASNALIVLP